MKKILTIACCALFVLSIMASVSDDLQTTVAELTGNTTYSTAMVPMPPAPDQLASTADNAEQNKQN